MEKATWISSKSLLVLPRGDRGALGGCPTRFVGHWPWLPEAESRLPACCPLIMPCCPQVMTLYVISCMAKAFSAFLT